MNASTTNTEHNSQQPADVPSAPPEAHQQAGGENIGEEGPGLDDEGEGSEDAADARVSGLSATYSPDDNKLRLYSVARLDRETYDRVKAAGFKWAPKQELFVAPMWTPAREDLLIKLCGEVGDEDTSLVARAEARADRFEEYSDKRGQDANAARRAVSAIADNIPLGQPILVGHHSQRHAEKHAEQIERGMQRAVRMWETSQYWKHRAAGALGHAKYKEDPGVRYRRIKGIEADLRKQVKGVEEVELLVKLWSSPDLNHDRAVAIANRMPHSGMTFLLKDYPRDPPVSQYEGPISLWSALTDGICTFEQARDRVLKGYARNVAWAQRWITHYNHRLEYERAMLQESGDIAAAKYDLAIGGRVLVGDTWSTIVRLNKKGGKVVSVSTNSGRWPRVPTVEQIKDYQAPSAEAAQKAAAVSKLPPLCNYKHETFAEMTKAEWERIYSDYKATRILGKDAPGDKYNRLDKTPFEAYGPHRVRSCIANCVPNGPGGSKGHGLVLVYITDLKTTPPPMPHEVAPMPEKLQAPEMDQAAMAAQAERAKAYHAAKAEPNEFDAMRNALKAGVTVVSAAQLFPTPVDLAARMVDLAGIEPDQPLRVLEPNSGTLRLLQALPRSGWLDVVAVEINHELAQLARSSGLAGAVHCRDFLEVTPDELGERFDLVVMNPPFGNAADVRHIKHAVTFLKPGGQLVALCAAGPRQHEALQPLVERMGGTWEPLPPDTFAEAGTSVRTVLLSFTAAEEAAAVV